MGLVGPRHCPACREVSSALCLWGQTPSLCHPAVQPWIRPLPRDWLWGTLVSQPPGGTRYV